MPVEAGPVGRAANRLRNNPAAHPKMSTADPREVDVQILSVLRGHSGQYLTTDIVAAATDYSEGYVRDRLHVLEAGNDNGVVKERRYKDIYGVMIGNNFVVITDNREHLIDIVKDYRPSELDAATAMNNDELRSFIIDEIADQEVTSQTDILYFGVESGA